MKIQISILLFLIAATVATRMHIIPGGQDSVAHSNKWLVSLAQRVKASAGEPITCGAALLRVPYLEDASDIIMTAAHCVTMAIMPCKQWWMRLFGAIAGNHDRFKVDPGQVSRNITGGACHHNWDMRDKTKNLDLALLKLSEPIKFSDTIQPIKLPKKGDRVEPGTECTLAGWGVIKFDGRSHPEQATVLQEMKVVILNQTECAKRDPTGFDPKTQICETSATGKGHACEGDSGGPLVCKKDGEPVVQGVVSYGSAECLKYGKPPSAVIYISTATQIDWIEEQIQKLNKPK